MRADPPAHPLRDGWPLTSRQDASPPLDDHEPFDVLGIASGVPQGDVPTQGVGNDPQRRQLLLVDELGDVVHELRWCVRGPCAPLRVTVTAQVRRDDVVPLLKVRGGPVPVVGMITVAVDEQQRRGVRVAPVEVVQPELLEKYECDVGPGIPGSLARRNPGPRPSFVRTAVLHQVPWQPRCGQRDEAPMNAE